MGPCLRTGRRRRFPLWVCKCVGGMFGGGLCQFDEMSLSGNACLSQQPNQDWGGAGPTVRAAGVSLRGLLTMCHLGKLGYLTCEWGPQTFVPKQ